ncbi:hypothetical protein AKJ47_02430 [candidate division MSBL1 archaeon SCGC-AAA261G05]|uniref:Uncharacterized protein n=2 Tax=candidate division MSBL1 TaxID=215777 RepID=A0A133VA91_9EURY|nr:hypothetical protein AKJ47_02430 [candidate division MSBL1 archaeon SCGC-AAA261G05]KXB04444.1 hypothetical protein AKJ48_02555 [candidate division MSBL1 archaeon SCGC-AAA261O19]
MDVFKLDNILSYYSSLGVKVPKKHSKYGMIERWIGYLPVGFVLSWVLNLEMVLLIIIVTLALVGPIELYLMYRGFGPWKFFRGKPLKIVAKIFLLEAYNVVGYFLLGVLLQLLILG